MHVLTVWVLISYTALVNVFDANDKLTVNERKFEVKIQNGLPLVYTPAGGDNNSHQEL